MFSDGQIYKLPVGQVRQTLFKDRFNLENDNIVFLESTKGREPIPLVQSTAVRPSTKVDQQWGAINTAFYMQGYCEPQYEDIENKSETHGIAIGDSFTYCTALQPNQAWPQLLGNLSGRVEGKVYNLGVSGQGLHSYYEILKDNINTNLKYIFVGIYEGNDLRDAEVHYQQVLDRRNLMTIHADNSKKKFMAEIRYTIRDLLVSTYVFNFVWSAVGSDIRDYLFAKEIETLVNYQYEFTNEDRHIAYNRSNVDTDEVMYGEKLSRLGNKGEAFVLNLWEEPILWIKSLADRYHAKLTLIYIPSAHTSFGSNVKFEDENIGKRVKHLSNTQRMALRKICIKHSLDCLDTVADFVHYNEVSEGVLSHFPDNVHLTHEGHQVISNSIISFLGKQ